MNRNHKGDPNGQPPFVVVEPKKQREALELPADQVFGPEAYQLPDKLYDYIGVTHWKHWGMRSQTRPDFALNEIVLMLQDHVLGQIMSPITLSRILDSEAKTPNSQDAFTAAELLQGLTGSIFSEIDGLEKAQNAKFTDRKPAISNLRRNLQQHYFERLADLAMGSTAVPTDCQTVATVELAGLETRLKQILAGKCSWTPTRVRTSATWPRGYSGARRPADTAAAVITTEPISFSSRVTTCAVARASCPCFSATVRCPCYFGRKTDRPW